MAEKPGGQIVNLSPTAWAKFSIQALRIFRLRRSGAAVGRGTWVGAGVVVRRGWARGRLGSVEIRQACRVEDGTVLDAYGGDIVIGKNVFLGPYSVIYGHGGVAVGEDCLISMHCRILSSNHTVPVFRTVIRSQPDKLLPTQLGRDVWLGAGVTVLGGVVVGDGCVIGAGSVVTKSIPPGAVAFGNPAEIKRFRDGSPDLRSEP